MDRKDGNGSKPRSDAGQAVRFLAVKAAIFILVPLAAAVVTVLLVLK
ncbi:MAG: hypothetical protein KDJ37_05215 [Hyphomicrobiaceae bacterium]|nr:hypothetical protein [Hyphomicrobiaceae bacterium]